MFRVRARATVTARVRVRVKATVEDGVRVTDGVRVNARAGARARVVISTATLLILTGRSILTGRTILAFVISLAFFYPSQPLYYPDRNLEDDPASPDMRRRGCSIADPPTPMSRARMASVASDVSAADPPTPVGADVMTGSVGLGKDLLDVASMQSSDARNVKNAKTLEGEAA